MGSAVAFDPVVEGEALTFTSPEPGMFVDEQTGSAWDLTGRALVGEFERTQLELVDHHVPFWCAWSAFNSDADIWGT